MGKPVKNEENYKFEINNLNLHYVDFPQPEGPINAVI